MTAESLTLPGILKFRLPLAPAWLMQWNEAAAAAGLITGCLSVCAYLHIRTKCPPLASEYGY